MRRTTFTALAAVLTSAVFSKLSAQEKTPACALLSSAEITKATGRDYPEGSSGDAEGEGAGGGSSCQYGGMSFGPGEEPPMVSFVLIRDKGYTAQRRAGKLPPGCKIVPQKVGDEAYFESCPKGRSTRSDPLFVKAGTNDLIVQMDIEAPATEASVRPLVIKVAEAAVEKLRRNP
jgi:hypothetical protein